MVLGLSEENSCHVLSSYHPTHLSRQSHPSIVAKIQVINDSVVRDNNLRRLASLRCGEFSPLFCRACEFDRIVDPVSPFLFSSCSFSITNGE